MYIKYQELIASCRWCQYREWEGEGLGIRILDLGVNTPLLTPESKILIPHSATRQWTLDSAFNLISVHCLLSTHPTPPHGIPPAYRA